MQQKNVNVKSIDTTVPAFFRLWLVFLQPFHKMTDSQMDIVSFLLYERYKLKLKIKDEEYIDELLLTSDNRKKLKERMGYATNQVLSNALNKLREKGVLKGNSINRALLPNIEDEPDNFKLVFNFNINEA